jgi:L-galactose dehydrogenase
MREVDVDQIQSYCHYCLNDDALAGIVPELENKGVAIFNSAPLAMRLLSNEGPPNWHPAPAEVRERCAQAAEYCRKVGADLGRLALQFSIANPAIPVNIVGSANPERVLDNIRNVETPLDRELLEKVLEILLPVHNLSWRSGIPENNPDIQSRPG